MYSIRFDPAHDLLDIMWHAQFTPDAVRDYAAEVRRGFGDHGFGTGYRLRIDMSRAAVQTQAAVESFLDAFRGFPVASRIAVVTPSALAAMQVRRTMPQRYLRIFRQPEAAWEWLVADEIGGAGTAMGVP